LSIINLEYYFIHITGGTNGNSSSCVPVPARNKAAFKNSAGVKAGTAGARRFADMMCRDAVNSTYQVSQVGLGKPM